jgi:hypothetical protein
VHDPFKHKVLGRWGRKNRVNPMTASPLIALSVIGDKERTVPLYQSVIESLAEPVSVGCSLCSPGCVSSGLRSSSLSLAQSINKKLLGDNCYSFALPFLLLASVACSAYHELGQRITNLHGQFDSESNCQHVLSFTALPRPQSAHLR